MDPLLHLIPLRITKLANPVILRDSVQRNGTDKRRIYSLAKQQHLATRSSVNAEKIKLVFEVMSYQSKIKDSRWIRTAPESEK